MDAIDEFLRFPRIVSGEQLESLPYVVASNEQRMNAISGEKIYVRGVNGNVGDEFVIARLNYIYEQYTNDDGGKSTKNTRRSVRGEALPHKNEPAGFVWRKFQEWGGRPVEVLGYELWEIARGTVLKTGDPAIVEVVGGRREVKVGDYILPVDSYVYDSHFYPRASDTIPTGMHIMTASESVFGVGHYGIVSLSGGARDGVQPGHLFSAFRPGLEIADIVKYPKGTNKRMAARDERPVKEQDRLRHPSERL
jgi:hypothetical protein